MHETTLSRLSYVVSGAVLAAGGFVAHHVAPLIADQLYTPTSTEQLAAMRAQEVKDTAADYATMHTPSLANSHFSDLQDDDDYAVSAAVVTNALYDRSVTAVDLFGDALYGLGALVILGAAGGPKSRRFRAAAKTSHPVSTTR